MQHRMKTHQLDRQQIDSLLDRAEVASLATINADGTPYVAPVHFLYQEGAVYVHGLPAGQKIDNIKANPAVCLTVCKMEQECSYLLGNSMTFKNNRLGKRLDMLVSRAALYALIGGMSFGF